MSWSEKKHSFLWVDQCYRCLDTCAAVGSSRCILMVSQYCYVFLSFYDYIPHLRPSQMLSTYPRTSKTTHLADLLVESVSDLHCSPSPRLARSAVYCRLRYRALHCRVLSPALFPNIFNQETHFLPICRHHQRNSALRLCKPTLNLMTFFISTLGPSEPQSRNPSRDRVTAQSLQSTPCNLWSSLFHLFEYLSFQFVSPASSWFSESRTL